MMVLSTPTFHCAGVDDEGAKEMMRLYQTIHTDHEVCSHINCTTLIGQLRLISAPYLASSALRHAALQTAAALQLPAL